MTNRTSLALAVAAAVVLGAVAFGIDYLDRQQVPMLVTSEQQVPSVFHFSHQPGVPLQSTDAARLTAITVTVLNGDEPVVNLYARDYKYDGSVLRLKFEQHYNAPLMALQLKENTEKATDGLTVDIVQALAGVRAPVSSVNLKGMAFGKIETTDGQHTLVMVPKGGGRIPLQ